MGSCGNHSKSYYTPERGAPLAAPVKSMPTAAPLMKFLKRCEVRSTLIAILVIMLLKKLKML